MPKLYHNSHDEGWQVPGHQDRTAMRIDVPGSPVDLAAWLNERRVPAGPAHQWQLGQGRDGFNQTTSAEPQLADDAPDPATCNTPVGDPNRCSVCQTRLVATEEGALILGRSADLDAFDLWLEGLDVTGLRSLQRAAEAIRDRARALGLEWNERSVQ